VHRIAEKEKVKNRPHLSLFALFSFIASFVIARIFTTFHPDVGLRFRGYHIHHFWFGVALLAIGGWLGISYESPRATRIAAILFGAGGGLIGDEVGLLLTFGNYWTTITYTLVIIFLAFASALIILARYWQSVSTEFTEFLRSDTSLYAGVFLLAISLAFTLERYRSPDAIAALGVSAVVGFVMIVANFIQRIRTRQQEKRKK
jgi:hypothetical protein